MLHGGHPSLNPQLVNMPLLITVISSFFDEDAPYILGAFSFVIKFSSDSKFAETRELFLPKVLFFKNILVSDALYFFVFKLKIPSL